ncbi:hypothetical protein Cni_G05287 [Canna indica]|uniref:Pentatricopeptide repeat-containing protein n=1 Tax=Canna indica TaxID=4628 RepID=A0AAQ3Q4T7_9LILI|nr:hypothetical protein Cni_G05287 [Canna indica]
MKRGRREANTDGVLASVFLKTRFLLLPLPPHFKVATADFFLPIRASSSSIIAGVASSNVDRLAAILSSTTPIPLPKLNQIHAHLLRSFPDAASDSLIARLFNNAIRSLSKSPLHSASFAAFRLYFLMTRVALRPGRFTLPFLLNCSAAIPSITIGAEIHSRAIRSGLLSVLPVANALVDMYGKCGSLLHARAAFLDIAVKDVVSYNAVLGAHARLGADMPAAQRVFDAMPHRNVISWNSLIVGYVNAGDIPSGRDVFDRMSVSNIVSWTVLIVGYCKAGAVVDARELFDRMPEKNLVSWTAMITGYSQCGMPKEALSLFHELERRRIEPDAATMVGVISASAQVGSLELANWVGSYVDQNKIERNERVLTALVDMHAKCGNVEKALLAFKEIPSPDAYSYTALINGLASHGHEMMALEIFDRMQQEAIKPDPITFVGVLSACSHAGLVDKGLEYWESMVQDYGMERRADHYACVVDMLGRAGRLKEAYAMIQSMPMGPHPGALGALLAACRTYSNIGIAENVAKELFKLEPQNTGNYILLSSIYAERGQWDDAERVRSMIRGRKFDKLPGLSWIDDQRRGRRFQNKPESFKLHKIVISKYQVIPASPSHSKELAAVCFILRGCATL